MIISLIFLIKYQHLRKYKIAQTRFLRIKIKWNDDVTALTNYNLTSTIVTSWTVWDEV